MVLAVLAMVELDEVAEGVRKHLDPPGIAVNRFLNYHFTSIDFTYQNKIRKKL